MAAERRFTLIGNFTDNITPKLKSINKSLASMEKTLAGFDRLGKKSGLAGNLTKANEEAEKLKKSLTGVSKLKYKNLAEGVESANRELKTFGKQINNLNKNGYKFDKSGITAAIQEAKVLGKTIDDIASKGFAFDRGGLQSAMQDAKLLGSEIDQVARNGFHFDRSGLQAAQQDARVLSEILKANALIQVGQGVVGAGQAGFQGGMRAINQIVNFTRARFQEAAQDQQQDIMARGSLFGSLNKEQMFANAKNIKDQEKLKKINEDNYDVTRSISRSMEGAIADVVKNSTVSTATISTLSRQLSDNLLPGMLKAKKITDLSQFSGPEGRKELDKIMGGDKGIGKELATLYEQMGSIITSPSYAPMAAMGFTQFLGQGSINRQLQIFEQNPVLVDAMRKYQKEEANTVEGRAKALKRALEVAMPQAALQEARSTIMGGMQSIQDNLTNATAGILSMGADIANQGQKTLAMAKRTGALDQKMENWDRKQSERRAAWMKEKSRTDAEVAAWDKRDKEQRIEYMRGLERMYENADSPIEIIAASFGPLMQKFADFLGSAGNLFINPVMAMMEKLQLPLAQLEDNLDNLASDVRGKRKSFAWAIGRAFAELFKAIATLFDPAGVADQGGSAIQKAFRDFSEGFGSLDGKKYMDIILKGIGEFVSNVVFNGGDILKGLTPIGDGLLKVFMLLAAPAFLSALISGLVPVAVMSMGTLVKGVFSELMKSVSGCAESAAESCGLPGAGGGGGAAGAGGRRRRRGRYGRGGSIERLNRLRRFRMASTARGLGGVAGDIVSQGYGMAGRPGLGLLRGTRGLARSVGRVGRLIPGGALAAGAIDVGLAVASGENFGKAAAGLFGSVLGGAIGTVFGPAGTLIGGVAGSYLGDKIYDLMAGPSEKQKRAAALQMEAALQQKQLAGLQKSGIDIDAAGGKFLYGSSEELAKRVSFLGLQTDLSVRSFQSLYKLDEEKQKAAQKAADALNGEISRLEKLGRPSVEIAANVRGLQTTYNRARAEAQTSLTELNKQWAKIGGESKKVILESFKNMPVGQVEKAIADGIRNNLKLQGIWGTVPPPSNTPPGPKPPGWKPGIYDVVPPPKAPVPGTPRSPRLKEGVWGSASGSLGDAVSKEMKMKPPGSDLVIANSSETIIPAAGGNSGGGMVDFVEAFRSGLAAVARAVDDAGQRTRSLYAQGTNAVTSVLKQNVTVQQTSLTRINQTLVSNQNQTNIRLAKLEAKMTGSGIGLGGGSGGPPIFNAAAARFGLTMTSGYRPGDPGYHGINRARDYSNSTGPTPQMMGFARFLASNYGRNLKELIYTPLGFSIKNGRKVPPYAQSSHYNHVHVAYAFGAGSPAFFSSKEQARTWEKKMAPSNSAIATVTTNSSERFGAQRTLNAPITIYQQPNQDPEELAAIVAMRLSMAIEELENHV